MINADRQGSLPGEKQKQSSSAVPRCEVQCKRKQSNGKESKTKQTLTQPVKTNNAITLSNQARSSNQNQWHTLKFQTKKSPSATFGRTPHIAILQSGAQKTKKNQPRGQGSKTLLILSRAFEEKTFAVSSSDRLMAEKKTSKGVWAHKKLQGVGHTYNKKRPFGGLHK